MLDKKPSVGSISMIKGLYNQRDPEIIKILPEFSQMSPTNRMRGLMKVLDWGYREFERAAKEARKNLSTSTDRHRG